MTAVLDTIEPVALEDLKKGIRVPRADFEQWLEKHDWTWTQLARKEFPSARYFNNYTQQEALRRPYSGLDEFQLSCLCNDPGLWVPAFLREPEDIDHKDPYTLWDYQLSSIRTSGPTLHKCGAEVGKTREIVAYGLWKFFTVQDGSGLIGAPQQTHLDEIIDAMLEQLDFNEDLAPSLIKHKKHPHHMFRGSNRFKLYFRPSGHDGEAYRGVHVRTFAIKDEAAKDDHKKQWSEFFRAIKPGCVPKLYSVPDGRRDTEFYRLSKLSEGAKDAEQSEALKSASKYIKSISFKLFRWSKELMPFPYWSEDRKRFYIDLYGGEDSPEFKHNVLGEDGDPENTVFPWQQFKHVVKEIPEYRSLKILIDARNNDVIVRGYRCEVAGYGDGPVSRAVSLIDTVLPLEGFFDYQLTPTGGMTDSEFRKLIKGFFVTVPGLNRCGGDFGFSQDPTEILIKNILGDKKRVIARLQLKQVTYDQQCQAIDALDDLYCTRNTISHGTDLGNAGSAVLHDLNGLPQYRHKEYDDRLRGFQFESTTDNIDEHGEPILDSKDDKPSKITLKELATDHMTRRVQRMTIEYPPDPDIVTSYTGHTCVYGSKHRIYSKNNDHIIDADRAETLAEILGFEREDEFACGSRLR
ncbi:MAG: hypothetical protein OEW15_17560 [Nitrospirota bacterium]|nr:hypothetical protein [Nitrospirota bacterium]